MRRRGNHQPRGGARGGERGEGAEGSGGTGGWWWPRGAGQDAAARPRLPGGDAVPRRTAPYGQERVRKCFPGCSQNPSPIVAHT